MARGVNKVILVGNAGNPPETRYFPSGDAVTNVSIATSETWTDKQTGGKNERTEWHRLVFADRGNYKMGKLAGELIKKGSKVFVEGSLRTREWEKDGIKRYSTEIIVSEFQLLDPMPTDQQQQQPAPQQSGYGQQPQQNYGQAPQGYGQPQQPAPQPQSFGSLGNTGGNAYAAAQNQPPQQQRVPAQQEAPQQAGYGVPPQQSQQPQPPDFDDDIPF